MNIIRSHLFRNDIHATVFLERLGGTYPDRKTISIVVSGTVKESAKGTNWENKFQEVDSSKIAEERLKAIINEHGAYWFVPNDDASQ